MKRLSIIVPMYNVEPYIERCLRSLEDQDIPRDDYEIICINDGSSDNSLEVVVNLQKEFNNILLFDQKNQGVSMARNNGIDRARGKFVTMVDADDYIRPNVLKQRLDALDYHNLDIGFTGYVILDENLKEDYCYDPSYVPEKILNGIEYSNYFRHTKETKRDDHSSCAIFFKTNFLNTNNLRYLADVPFLEDGEFKARAICLANRVLYINGPFYVRTIRPGSATNSGLYSSVKARNGYIKAANNLLQFKNNNCKNKEQKDFMNRQILHFTIVTIISVKTKKYFKYYPLLHQSLKKGPLRKLETEGCSYWQKKMALYYNRSIHCFYLYWIFFKALKSIKIRLNKILSVYFILLTVGTR